MDSDKQRELEAGYEADRRASLALWNQRLAWLALPCFGLLFPADPYLPLLPMGVWPVWIMRAGIMAVFVVLGYASSKPWVKAHPDALGVVIHVMGIGVGIGGLAALSGGSASIYRENNLVALMIWGLLIPWKVFNFVAASFVAIGVVALLFFMTGTVGQMGEFLNYMVLLTLCTLLSAVAVYIKGGLSKKVFISSTLLAEAHHEMSADLEQARTFQQQLLPKLPSNDAIKFAARYQPATFLGGDFYEVAEMAKDWYRVFLTDVTGHGTQAAIRTMILQQQFSNFSPKCKDPEDLLLRINNSVIQDFGSMAINYCALCLDFRREGDAWRVVGANAGLPPPSLMHNGTAVMVEDNGTYQGIVVDPDYKRFEHSLQKGDGMLIATDGVVDLLDGGTASWNEINATLSHKTKTASPEELLTAVMQALPQRDPMHSRADDLTAIAILT